MKVLSLRQPWASLVVHGIKKWETRGWRPGDRNRKLIERDGLLIHASLTKKSASLMGSAPFSNHLSTLGILPYGAIIGRVKIGRLLSTKQWVHETAINRLNGDLLLKDVHEKAFGDYSPGRWAWELLEPELFPQPIPFRGKLTIWDYDFSLSR